MKISDLTKISLSAVPPEEEPARQYYFIAKARILLKEKEKEEKKLQGELSRVNGMLSNEKFLSKAPESKIAEEKEKLEKYTQMMAQVKERLGALKK